ncbi:MAG: glycosyltransferase [Clostridia bacterium]|nr:glycosyltransferase [Clostridia bacterium]
MCIDKIFPRGSKRREFVKKIYIKYFEKYSEEERIYKKWIEKNEPNKNELEEQKNTEFEIKPKISIVVPVYNTPEKFFDELVKSLKNQTYPNWELCLADGSPEPLKYMQEYPKKDKRIKYKIIGENKGISGNTNEALTLATGDYIGLLDHDDLLPIFSLYEVVKAINENPEAEFIYSDEDKLETANGPRYGVFFKPDFSPYTLNSANYICHFSIFKKELMDKLGGFRSEYDGSQDFDIVARASELTNNIVHIPKVLYHWRAHKNSTAQNSDSKPYAFEIGKKVIKDHIKRSLDTDVEVTDGLTPGSYEVKYFVKDNPMVSIIIDGTKMTKEQLEKTVEKLQISTYTNYELIALTEQETDKVDKIVKPEGKIFEDYNKAILMSNGKYFIVVDENLISIDKKSYIEDLVGICQDNNVGIVGTKLYNKEKLIEHSGIIIGMNGAGDFLYKGAPKDIGTYMQRLLIIHNVSCVYVKYAMIDKDIFMQIGKFTDEFTGVLISIDTCLKMLASGKQVVINPIISICVDKLDQVEKDENEEIKIQDRWKEMYKKGDVYFSPNLSKTNTGLSLNI